MNAVEPLGTTVVDPATTALILDVLSRAATAHGRYEIEIGHEHAEWAPWYAAHMARTFADGGYTIVAPDQR